MNEEIPPGYPDMMPPPRRPIAWVTWGLIGTTVAVFLAQLHWLHLYGDDVIGDTLAFSPQAWADHRYWTLVTYAWAHAVVMFDNPSLYWLHIVSNMIPLYCLGPALEGLIGRWRYLGLYLGGAIASALVWFVFNLDAGPDAGIIGASGAVFAVIAGIGTVAPRERVTVFLLYVLPLNMSMRVLALSICGVEAASILFHWMPEIAHSAHLGGAAFGFLYVLAVKPKTPVEYFAG